MWQKLSLIFLFISFTVLAQNPGKYKLQKISIEKGLSQSVITGITQDKLGFMWFSTQDGVNRYDGYHFVNFYNQKGNPKSLSNNFTKAILCDNDNEIWVATLDGLCKYDYYSEGFTIFYYDPTNVNSVTDNEINCLALASNGNIWIGTANNGVCYYNKKSKQFTAYKKGWSEVYSLVSNHITALLEDKDSILWVGTFDSGVESINLKTKEHKQFKDVPEISNFFLFNHIRCIYEDDFSNIWIGTNRGLVRYNKKNNFTQLFSYEANVPESINGNIVMSVFCDSSKNLWVGTEENGLNILNLKKLDRGPKPVFEQIRMRENNYGLSIRSVYTMFYDKYKNIWVGTYSGGINFISSQTEKFQKYQHNPYDKATICYPKVWGICEDKSGNIWVGTDGGGLDRLNPRTNTIKHFEYSKNNPSSISDNAILCAYRDHNNTLWFGTYAGGLNKYNEYSESFTCYKPIQNDTNSLPAKDVRVIYEDRYNNLWIGTNGGGLCTFNSQRNNFVVYNHYNSKLPIDVRALCEDADGNLWIGSYSNGVCVMNVKTGYFKQYRHDKNDNKSLSDNYVYDIIKDNKNNIWIGTGNGLSMFKRGNFVNFDEKNGLANNFIHALVCDRNNNLWISTNKGISEYVSDENKFQNYDFNDGLQLGEFNDGSGLLAQNGQLWFGGINGLNTFIPENVSKSNFQPDVILTEFQLFNNPVKARTQYNPESPLRTSISTTKSITLNYKQSVFTIDFVALNYSFPEKTQYAYRLAGYEEGWNEAGTRRTATYRELPAGKYTFEVRATNQDNIWNGKTASLEIIVKPPFWKTWWAYMIYALFIGFLVYIVLDYYKKQTALQNKLLLEQYSHQKDTELNQERFRFFTNISHEFRTPLTLILGPVEEILEKENHESTLGRKLVLIYKNAHKLLDLINMLLDFRKVESGNMELKVSKTDLVKFSYDVVNSFRELSSQKGIGMHFKASPEHIEAWVDRENFEIIYNNLLSNALKFTPKGGTIKVEIAERPAQILNTESNIIAVSVSDSGIGIPEKNIEHIFESYYSLEHSGGIKGTGIGLALTKSLVEMHHAAIKVDSIEKEGTTFTIEIQKGNSHFSANQILDISNESDFDKPDEKRVLSKHSNTSLAKFNELDPEQLADKRLMLIVEDNEDVRDYIYENFQDNFTVLTASNGLEGFNLATKHVPDIIISDVMMPEMDGIEFCHKVKSTLTTCHIPVILLTARSSITHKKEGYETGADSYVTKPFSVDLLETRVENLLQSRKQLKSYYTRVMLLQTAAPLAETPDDKFMNQLVVLVEKYMSDPDFDVIKLSKELSMSRPVLYRKVKALTDLSIVEFVRTVRMNKAAQLLKSGQYRVSDVAFEVGFNDLKYFRQCFKEQFNITPSDLIRNQEGEEG